MVTGWSETVMAHILSREIGQPVAVQLRCNRAGDA